MFCTTLYVLFLSILSLSRSLFLVSTNCCSNASLSILDVQVCYTRYQLCYTFNVNRRIVFCSQTAMLDPRVTLVSHHMTSLSYLFGRVLASKPSGIQGYWLGQRTVCSPFVSLEIRIRTAGMTSRSILHVLPVDILDLVIQEVSAVVSRRSSRLMPSSDQ